MRKLDVVRYVCDSRKHGYAHGRQEWFSTKADALNRAGEIAESLVKGNTLSDEERNLFLYYKSAIGPFGISMEEVLKKALHRLQNKVERDEDERKTVADLVDLWLEDKRSGKFSNLRPVTIKELVHTAVRIKSLWGELQIQSISKEHLEHYIGNLPVGYSTKRGWRVKIPTSGPSSLRRS